MPIDPSISLAAKTPSISDAMGNISSIIGARQGMINLQRSEATLPYDISSAEAGARTAQAGANVAENTVQPRIQEAKATADQATATAQSAQLNYQNQSLTALVQQVNLLQYDPNLNRGKVLNFIASTASNLKTPSAMVAQMVSKVPDTDDPVELKGYLQHVLTTLQDKATQLQQMTPQPSLVGTGQQIVPINVGGNVPGVPIGTQVGAPIQQQLPPTTPVFNPKTNAPGYLGPQTQTQPVQSGPSLGTAENIGGTVQAVNQDWSQTMAQAAPAAQNIGVLQNIKQFAPGAVTGVASDRRSFIAGLAGLIGMTPAQMEKTDTDLLAKNSNMLALAGGNTDAARALAEAANPNTHMTPDAIIHAANQVIAQQQMAITKQQYMGQFKGNPQAYTQALTKFNAVADPRIFQLKTMSPQEIAKMKASMTPAEQKDFGNKIRAMEQMGLVQ